MAQHAKKTQRHEIARAKVIAEEFDTFRARDMDPPDISGFLTQYRTDRRRTTSTAPRSAT